MGVVGGVKNAWDADEEELRVFELTGKVLPLLSSLSASLLEALEGRLRHWSRRRCSFSLFACFRFSFCCSFSAALRCGFFTSLVISGRSGKTGGSLMIDRPLLHLFGFVLKLPLLTKTRKSSEDCFSGGELLSFTGGLSIFRNLAESSASLVSLSWRLSSWVSWPPSTSESVGVVGTVRMLPDDLASFLGPLESFCLVESCVFLEPPNFCLVGSGWFTRKGGC